MKRERNALKAGIFIVFSIVLSVATILLIRGDGTGPTQLRVVAFSITDDLNGLAVGDEVRIGGVKVGTVHDITLKTTAMPLPQILVTVSMPASYELHKDAILAVQASLTGPPNLNVTSMGSGPPLAGDDKITGAPDAKSALIATLTRAMPRLEAIVADVQGQTLPKLNHTLDSAGELVQHVNTKVDPLIGGYDKVITRANTVLSDVHELVGDNASNTDLRGTMKNLNATTAKLPAMLDKINPVIEKLDGAMSKASATLEDIQKAAANAKEVTVAARSILVDNRSKLDGMIKSLKTMSDNLKATSVEVRHSPWRLLYKPSPDEIGNLNLYDSAREFAEGANSLTDAATSLSDALKNPNTDKAQLQKLLDGLDQTFKKFQGTEDKFWTKVKE